MSQAHTVLGKHDKAQNFFVGQKHRIKMRTPCGAALAFKTRMVHTQSAVEQRQLVARATSACHGLQTIDSIRQGNNVLQCDGHIRSFKRSRADAVLRCCWQQ
jgi:hypothetical protein